MGRRKRRLAISAPRPADQGGDVLKLEGTPRARLDKLMEYFLGEVDRARFALEKNIPAASCDADRNFPLDEPQVLVLDAQDANRLVGRADLDA